MKASTKTYQVKFDRSGASYVERDVLLSDPRVIRQFEAGARIVKAQQQQEQGRQGREREQSR
ncbi:MAG: hypothetical protein IAE99_12895 [Rhodothermales bacterium]|nr:hypothetical protein [Rhodothermales bacterium]